MKVMASFIFCQFFYSLACDCAAKARSNAIFLTNYEECYATKVGSGGKIVGGQATDDKCINSNFQYCATGQNCMGVNGY